MRLRQKYHFNVGRFYYAGYLRFKHKLELERVYLRSSSSAEYRTKSGFRAGNAGNPPISGISGPEWCQFSDIRRFLSCTQVQALKLTILKFRFNFKSKFNDATKFYFDLGKVNLNLLPFPTSLSIHIFPPFFSMNSLHNISPRPVPCSFAVPSVEW